MCESVLYTHSTAIVSMDKYIGGLLCVCVGVKPAIFPLILCSLSDDSLVGTTDTGGVEEVLDFSSSPSFHTPPAAPGHFVDLSTCVSITKNNCTPLKNSLLLSVFLSLSLSKCERTYVLRLLV